MDMKQLTYKYILIKLYLDYIIPPIMLLMLGTNSLFNHSHIQHYIA